MTAKINCLGCLEVERTGNFKAQFCPYTAVRVACGDWCPMFKETESNCLFVTLSNRLCYEISSDERQTKEKEKE